MRTLTLICTMLLAFTVTVRADVIPLDIGGSCNYDGYISNAECSHALLYNPPANWGLGNRMVHVVFGDHSTAVSGRNYAWQFQLTSGTALPTDGQITSTYGLFQLITTLDAEPVGGFVQTAPGTNPNGILPKMPNVVRASRPHSNHTNWPSAVQTVTLPVEQQGCYNNINFLVGGNNGKVLIYADYDNGQGGIDSVLIYESPGAPKTTAETGFPVINGTACTNPDIVELGAYRMDYYWSQTSDYSAIRSGTACVWTFAQPLALDPSRTLKGFKLAIYNLDTYKAREAIIFAASADSAQRRIHVDAINGSDSTGDGSAGAPFATLTPAWAIAVEGDIIVLYNGNYGSVEKVTSGSPTNLYSDWVTLEAAPGCSPQIEHIYFGANGGQWYGVNHSGTFDVYLHFKGLHIKDGLRSYGARHWILENCLIERYGPWLGSVDNIEKTAISWRGGNDTQIIASEITNTGTAIAARGHNVLILGNHIHGGTHDGIRMTGSWYGLIEGNLIHDFDDGVSDAEATWSRHCDLIHIFMTNNYADCINRDLTFRGNILYDVESQGVQFNNYQNGSYHNTNIIFENNVFGPTKANMFNQAEPVDGIIFRNNTAVQVPGGRIYTGTHTGKTYTLTNTTLRMTGSSDVQVYNNILGSGGAGGQVTMFDYNMIQSPGTPVGLDDSRAYGRFTIIGGDPLFVDREAFDGRLQAGSPAINAGTSLFAPTALYPDDIWQTARDNRPDLGAVELAGQSPPAQVAPTIYNDTKTTFVDDFEDGHYNDVDDYLQAPNTQGLSWQRATGFDTFKHYVTNTTSLDRNALISPTGSSTVQRVAWFHSQQGANWKDYDVELDAYNSYLPTGSGPVLLFVDTNNCYWLDIARDTGRLVRIMNGTSTVLASATGIRMPHSGRRHLHFGVRHVPGGITITVDMNGDGTTELSFTDTDATALTRFVSGGIGFHDDVLNTYNKLSFDNVRVNVVSFAP